MKNKVTKNSKDKYRNKWTDLDVSKFWDSVSGIYIEENKKVSSIHKQRFVEAIKWIDLKGGMKLLNVSSRDSEAVDFIQPEKNNIVMINAEISIGLINIAKRLRPNQVCINIGSYSALPFQNNYFDRILSLETIEHCSDPIKFLEELYRVSKKDARLVMSCPPETSEIPYRLYTMLIGGHGEGPHRFLSSKEIKEIMLMTGWKVILHKGTLLLPIGPEIFRCYFEKIIDIFQGTFISELGIRQFYVCEKY